ncbi:MAG: L,D-transpeptidase family protein [Actinobacteria bacterium]|jgi:lipoprotein-anchoring transpeptidase ErfK/SrfK|nr:L,D-transpeptidase family protein [Actinomycetota bacterium]
MRGWPVATAKVRHGVLHGVHKSGWLVAAVAAVLVLGACSGPAKASASDPSSTAFSGTASTGPVSPAVTVPPMTTSSGGADPSAPDPGTGGTASSPVDQSGNANPDDTNADPPPTTTSADPPTLTISPTPGSTTVNPAAPITAVAAGGTLTSVTLVNPTENVQVAGALSADKTSWQATQPLGYGKSYRLTATATNDDGQTVTGTSAFTTLTPHNMTMPYLEYTGRYPLTNGATYGVGIVPVVHFDEPIADRAAAQRTLQVTTSPHVDGSWYWSDAQNVHFRPKDYWPAGTKVTISANVYGVEVGPGLYGQSDVSTSFTIGRRQLTVAEDSAPKVDTVTVYDAAGKAIRTMNTSMGKHGGVTVDGRYINFYTPNGTYTVLDHKNPQMMSSASYGLPADAPGGYAPEPIYYSTRISTDGIFLHELNNTVWAQNHGYDVSHGCLNLNKANAVWFYNNSLIGDPVVIHGAKGAPQLQFSEGGEWSVPWSTWLAGSAIR